MLYNKLNLLVGEVVNDRREEISGIRFEDKATIGTDGFSLVKITTPNINPDEFPQNPSEPLEVMKTYPPFTISKKSIKGLGELISDDVYNIPILQCFGISEIGKETVSFVDTDLESFRKTTIKKMEDNYPDNDIKNLLKQKKQAKIEIRVDVKFLKRIIDIINRFLEYGDKEVKISISGNNDPIRFDVENKFFNQKLIALLMPRHSK